MSIDKNAHEFGQHFKQGGWRLGRSRAMSRDSSASVQLAGDARLQSSAGAFGLQIDSELVWLDVPDCRGEVTMYSFSFADWARVCDLMKMVTAGVLQ